MTTSNSSDSPVKLPPINGPEDVKNLPIERLDDLAAEIRRVLITSLSRTGGHLGPNLGVTELSIAMHRVFNTPKDKFFFDVSHQGYVHKMLTGRWDEIDTIRTYKGLNGFLLRTESEHDCYGAGHAGTALSAALGTAVARDLAGEDSHVVAVAGDAAFTCGPTFEALNNISEATKKFIVGTQRQRVVDREERRGDLELLQSDHHQQDLLPPPRHGGEFRREADGQGDAPPRSKVRGGGEEHDRPERHLRGVRPALLWPDRRPRHPAAGKDLRVPQGAGCTGDPAHRHRKRSRLRACARQA